MISQALSPFHALFDLILAILTAVVILRIDGYRKIPGRFVSIDGLRGYLAFFVFMHHSSIWYFFLHGMPWEVPPSNLYTNFGQSSVALFFMITGFLFYGKILKGRHKNIDWLRLYISRIMRLAPLYFSVIFALIILVGVRSDWTLNESVLKLIKGIIKWVGFTVDGAPNLNGIRNTWIMVAGVTWTLVYEWFFYISLPILSLVSLNKVPIPAILFSVSLLTLQHMFWTPNIIISMIFFGGILAAILSNYLTFVHFSQTRIASLIVLLSIIFEVTYFRSSYGIIQIILLCGAFCLIACGNNLFGILSHPISIVLGEISYGIYLMQGIVLFVYWKYIVGIRIATNFNASEYWIIQSICVPILILLSYLAFRYIEMPAINRVSLLYNLTVKLLGPKIIFKLDPK